MISPRPAHKGVAVNAAMEKARHEVRTHVPVPFVVVLLIVCDDRHGLGCSIAWSQRPPRWRFSR